MCHLVRHDFSVVGEVKRRALNSPGTEWQYFRFSTSVICKPVKTTSCAVFIIGIGQKESTEIVYIQVEIHLFINFV